MKLILSVTKRCNMRCPNCLWILEKGDFFNKDDMSLQDAIDIVEYYKKNKLKKVVLQGEGEVFLYPHFEEIYSYFLKSKISFDGMTTNGLILDKFLYVAKDVGLTISLDGYNSQSYIKHRGGGESQFNKVLDNIREVLKVKDRKKITINCIVSSVDYKKIPGMIALSESLGVDCMRFGNYHPIAGDLRPLFNTDKNIVDFYKNIISKNDYKVDITLPGLMNTGKKKFKCSMLKCKNVGSEGFYSPCCHISTDVKYGSFPNESKKLAEFKKQFRNAKKISDLPLPCRLCPRLFKNRIIFNKDSKKWSRKLL